jgi:hypothetical protein
MRSWVNENTRRHSYVLVKQTPICSKKFVNTKPLLGICLSSLYQFYHYIHLFIITIMYYSIYLFYLSLLDAIIPTIYIPYITLSKNLAIYLSYLLHMRAEQHLSLTSHCQEYPDVSGLHLFYQSNLCSQEVLKVKICQSERIFLHINDMN